MAVAEPETVFVTSTSNSSGSPRIVHTRADCEATGNAVRMMEKPLSAYPPSHRRWCRTCGRGAGDGDE